MTMPMRRFVVFVAAVVLTTMSATIVVAGVATRLLRPTVLVVALLIGTGVVWVIWVGARRTDRLTAFVVSTARDVQSEIILASVPEPESRRPLRPVR